MRQSTCCRVVVVCVLLSLFRTSRGAEEDRELVRDQDFARGFNVLAAKGGGKSCGTIRVEGAEPVWRLAQWHSRFEFADAAMNPAEAFRLENQGKWVAVARRPNEKAALTLGVDSRPEYEGKLRGGIPEPWVHLLVEQYIGDAPSLAELDALRLQFEARLVVAETFRPEGHTPYAHAAQYQLVMTLNNTNRASPGYGDFLWFNVPVYDDRYASAPEYVAQDFAMTQGKLIYNPGGRAFGIRDVRDGAWLRFDCDMRPWLVRALAAAWEKGYCAGSRDPADYRVASMNIGWEVPGLNRVAMELRGVSLQATTRSAGTAAVALPEPQPPRILPKPTPEQAAWQDLELGLFIHFDISVFTDGGEGDWASQGRLDPNLYNPTTLDTDQWLQAAQAMGAKYAVYVAKHCTGFLCWQSDCYPYGVTQSRWRDGKGDVVRDFTESCRKYGVTPGLYASVTANAHLEVGGAGLVNFGRGGDDAKQKEYVQVVERMYAELWGRYGELAYVWFDGGALPPAQGGPDLIPIITRLQPHAVAFQGPPGIPAGNTRWVGNEDGVAAYPCWATVRNLNDAGSGDPEGAVWQPGECDAPLRKHDWFWHPGSEGKIRGLDELVEMYYRSVGRNCNFILNAVIDREGRVPAADMRRFKELGDEIRRRFGKSLAETSGGGEVVELALPAPTVIDHVIIMEKITEGERIRGYVVEGVIDGLWVELAKGTCVGHKRIERFEPVAVAKVRLRVTDWLATPIVRTFAAYRVEEPAPPLGDSHWAFDEAAGEKCADGTGARHGTLRGAARAPGIAGSALALDGKGAHASLGDTEVRGQDFTFAAWIRPTGNAARERVIVSKERSGDGESQLRLYVGRGNRLGWALSGGGRGIWFESIEGAVPADRWSYVAVVRRGKEHALYVNGAAVVSRAAEECIRHRNRLEMRLGARHAPGSDAPDCAFEGLIDEARLWGRARAPEDLKPPAELLAR